MTQSDATIQSFHKLSRLASIFAKLSFASRHLEGIFTVFSYFHTCSFGSFWATESQKFQAALGRTWISRKFDKPCADSLDHFDYLNVRCTAQCLQLASVKLECSGMLFGLWIGLEYDAQRPTPWRRCTVHMKNDMYVAEKVMGTHGIVSRSRDCLGWHCRGFFLCVCPDFLLCMCVPKCVPRQCGCDVWSAWRFSRTVRSWMPICWFRKRWDIRMPCHSITFVSCALRRTTNLQYLTISYSSPVRAGRCTRWVHERWFLSLWILLTFFLGD